MAKLNEKIVATRARSITTTLLADKPFGLLAGKTPDGSYWIWAMARKTGTKTRVLGPVTCSEAYEALNAIAQTLGLLK